MSQLYTVEHFLAQPDADKPKWKARFYKSRTKDAFVDRDIEVIRRVDNFCGNCGSEPEVAYSTGSSANCSPCFKKTHIDAEFYKP